VPIFVGRGATSVHAIGAKSPRSTNRPIRLYPQACPHELDESQ